MTELKPCPFCGGEVIMNSYPERKGYGAVVECVCCLLQMQTINYDTEEEAKRKVSEAWNRRANDDKR